MQDFAAIDFETANNERSSVCSVGIVIVRGGKIVDKFYSLIKPEPDYYNYWCSKVHGLCASDTDNAPIFPEVWNQIEPRIAGLPLIAHNKAFDESCLKAVFRVYQMVLSLQDVVRCAAWCPQGSALGYGNHWAFSPPLIVVLPARLCLLGIPCVPWIRNSVCSVDP